MALYQLLKPRYCISIQTTVSIQLPPKCLCMFVDKGYCLYLLNAYEMNICGFVLHLFLALQGQLKRQ